MLLALVIAFVVSTTGTLFAIRFSRRYSRYTGDHDLSGPQKIHRRVVPRVGGVGIFLGFASAAGLVAFERPEERSILMTFLFCTIPVFMAGLLEDITKRISPFARLVAAAVGALLAALFLGATIDRTAIPGLDFIAAFPLGAIALAIFVVSGVVNAVNIIDGLNGLASMCVALMLGGLAYVSLQAGDTLIFALSLAAVGAVLGFFIWNYPNGLIFLGDGGAYFLGFVFAELAILFLHRNPQASPLFPLLLCSYPVFETLFSMYRRRFVRGRSMSSPDAIHLHSLIYRRLVRWAVGSKDAALLTQRNSMTAPYLWLICSVTVVPSLLWWNNTLALALCLLAFVVLYVFLYSSIVRFRTPRILVRYRRPRRARPRPSA